MTDFDILAGVPELADAIDIVLVNKGFSTDAKFRIVLGDGATYMLRVSDVGDYDKKLFQYNGLAHAVEAGIPAPRPISFGFCDGGMRCYMLLTWVEGEDLREALASAPVADQRSLGVKAGKLLKALHRIPCQPLHAS
ncbi:phosphotransferase family protein [Paraeggerthella hongkongensis]|uniref:Aminoglycoside phosphotransferase domain-containing protein n=1 Tax=Paraeggerthella hongkongensis TaxID=230658 RepID=A0A3N0BF40_9ACTN|nr:phosphotransferase [Paraeggerthella hongkongensis]RNL45999.1 hypothetical protein DMP08_04615 [Paraeggerthella hongkongensis]